MSALDLRRPESQEVRILRAEDRGWDEARRAFNLLIDQRPAAMALPRSAEDVAAAIRYARNRGLRVAAQATGHNAGPLGALDGTLLLNTSRLTGLSIDAADRRVRVGAGLKWGHVVPQLSDLGLAALHGSSPDVGIVGYTVGGGLSWLGRQHGLQCNAVQAFEVVTADGELLRTDPSCEPELFWALRGGGGSFGVVTAVEFTVQPVAELYAGALFFAAERASDVLSTWHGLLSSLPDQFTTWAALVQFAPLPEIPDLLRGRAFTVVMGAFLGAAADGRDLLGDLVSLGPQIDTFATVPPVGLSELAMDPPDPLPYRTAHQLVGALPSSSLDDFVAAVDMRPGASLAIAQLRHMGGALARRPAGAGALATLPGELSVLGVGLVTDEASSSAVDAALDAVTASLADHRVGHYSNFVEEPVDARRFFGESTWARLCRVKRAYDPADVIRGNHPIPLA
ncbi:FAD-binding oxidoreductase [Geodermatophilus sp. SYSU D00779]